jgi:hypothetical protein
LLRLLAITCLLGVLPLSPMATDVATLREEARAVVRQYAGQLKPTLQQAVMTDGPAAAVQVCASRAPQIAAELSRTSGWEIRRVSLKPRNMRTATAEDWVGSQLEDFDRRLAAGEPAAGIWIDATVNGEYRFLEAQPVEALCLTCHGAQIAPAIQAQLDRFYPDDRATGYQLGELRGAFYLTRPVEDASTGAMRSYH